MLEAFHGVQEGFVLGVDLGFGQFGGLVAEVRGEVVTADPMRVEEVIDRRRRSGTAGENDNNSEAEHGQ